MSKDPAVIPSCVFIANRVSRVGRPSVELNLEIKMSGSQPSAVNFLVDVHPQEGTQLFYPIHLLQKWLCYAAQ